MRLKKTANTLDNKGEENKEYYTHSRKTLKSIMEIIDDIDIDNVVISKDMTKIKASIRSISTFFKDIIIYMEITSNNGQINEYSLEDGNYTIEDLNNEIELIQTQINDYINQQANINSKLKKVAFRYICDIHGDIIKCCNSSIKECENVLSNLSAVENEDLEGDLDEFNYEIRLECQSIEEFLVEAENANERMSNGIVEKEKTILELQEKLKQLNDELSKYYDEVGLD